MVEGSKRRKLKAAQEGGEAGGDGSAGEDADE